MALDKAQNYLARMQMQNISDWGSVELDAEGQALQAELEERQTVRTSRISCRKLFANAACRFSHYDLQSHS